MREFHIAGTNMLLCVCVLGGGGGVFITISIYFSTISILHYVGPIFYSGKICLFKINTKLPPALAVPQWQFDNIMCLPTLNPVGPSPWESSNSPL